MYRLIHCQVHLWWNNVTCGQAEVPLIKNQIEWLSLTETKTQKRRECAILFSSYVLPC